MKNIKQKCRWYVYQGVLDGVVVYIGKGTGNRYKHLTSGVSHCKEANRSYFNEEEIIVTILDWFEEETPALLREKDLISQFSPKWNKRTNVSTKKVDSSTNKITIALERGGTLSIEEDLYNSLLACNSSSALRKLSFYGLSESTLFQYRQLILKSKGIKVVGLHTLGKERNYLMFKELREKGMKLVDICKTLSISMPTAKRYNRRYKEES